MLCVCGGCNDRTTGGSATTPDGRQVAMVALTVADGGQRRYWLAWLVDGTPSGRVVGRFATADEAMAATDSASDGT